VTKVPGVSSLKASASYAQRQRQRGQQYERHEQRHLAELLTQLIVPGTVFWTSVENRPRSAVSGLYQRLAGVRSGFPDVMFLRADHPPLFLEMKSLSGTLSKVQRRVRLELLAQGCAWFMARSALGALVALHRAGVEFRQQNGQPWQPPQLPDWEQPLEDLSGRHPAHPDVRAGRSLAKRRQRAAARERQRRGREVQQPLGDRAEAAQ
jgi:hypothetical protein